MIDDSTARRDIEAVEDAKFSLLLACDSSKTIAAEEYRRVASRVVPEARPQLVHYLAEADIEVRSELSMRALYHKGPERQYRPSRRELDSGRLECPRCHVVLIVVTRKAKDPLMSCPDCSWSIARSDVWDPAQGEEPALRDDVEYGEGVAPHPEEQEGPW